MRKKFWTASFLIDCNGGIDGRAEGEEKRREEKEFRVPGTRHRSLHSVSLLYNQLFPPPPIFHLLSDVGLHQRGAQLNGMMRRSEQLDLTTTAHHRLSTISHHFDLPLDPSSTSTATADIMSSPSSVQPHHPTLLIPGPIEFDDAVLQSMSHFS